MLRVGRSIHQTHASAAFVRATSGSWTRRTFSSPTSILSGTNTEYMEQMMQLWRNDPNSVHKSWDVFFRTGSFQVPPTLVPEYRTESRGPAVSGAVVTSSDVELNRITAKVVQLVRAFQVRGHFLANLDPLGLNNNRIDYKELQLQHYGLTEADLDKPIELGHIDTIRGFLEKGRGPITLRQLYARLRETYCGNIGYEYMHIPDVDKCNWIRERIETRKSNKLTPEQKLKVLDRLTWADHFEGFLKRKWETTKRFGLEGAESFIPGMKALISKSSELGVRSVVLGMPHRGRLNVLANVCRKPMEDMLIDFTGGGLPQEVEGSGDVKYHLGATTDREVGPPGKRVKMHISLLANPSHLEAVNPVVSGKTRAKQFYSKDHDRSKNMAILLHGDAAFAAQGLVYETFGMGDLPDYSVGGTIHIVVNNQIGFTTDPACARSSPYCSDIAKAFNAPIFHVNADDPEAVCHVCELAAEWRATFKKDVVVDLVCYRKHGHNEIDEPSFTQPAMYKKIAAHKPVLELYQEQLVQEGVTTKENVKALSDQVMAYYEAALTASKTYKRQNSWLHDAWEGLKGSKEYSAPQTTGVSREQLKLVGEKLTQLPEGFQLHKRLVPILGKKAQSIQSGKDLDWATAEALAFGSLLLEGKHVRLSGQDVERGTFSHRHAVLHDQQNSTPSKPVKFVPLNHLSADQAQFSVSNSSLSEYGVMGFELGYALDDPHALVCWEAQFGDFVNGAQIIMDQFLSSGEDKWLRQNGLVLLLPHGYEGQGPEHSSSRLERFLQMMNDQPDVMPAEDHPKQIQQANWQVVNCSTPANYFHVLRRQLYRQFRKTLVIATPKSLLRHELAKSSFEDMEKGTSFKQVIPEPLPLDKDKVKRVVFCSGKVYYDLVQARKDRQDVAIARVEQLGPFPFHLVRAEARRFPKADVVWVQEEPMNQGAWTYVAPRLETALKGDRPTFRSKYIGRLPAASTATGSSKTHAKEQEALVSQALAV